MNIIHLVELINDELEDTSNMGNLEHSICMGLWISYYEWFCWHVQVTNDDAADWAEGVFHHFPLEIVRKHSKTPSFWPFQPTARQWFCAIYPQYIYLCICLIYVPSMLTFRWSTVLIYWNALKLWGAAFLQVKGDGAAWIFLGCSWCQYEMIIRRQGHD